MMSVAALPGACGGLTGPSICGASSHNRHLQNMCMKAALLTVLLLNVLL